jgi:hypothetical protein
MSGPLTVSAPALDYQPIAGGHAALEKEIRVHVAPVRFADGTPVSAPDVRKAAGLIYRWNTPSAATEIWNAKARAWQSIGAQDLYAVAGLPFMPDEATPAGWEGFVIAMGGKDQWGNPQFATAVAHYPHYRMRAVFTAEVGPSVFKGMSADSAAFEFISTRENSRFGVGLNPSSPADATHFSLFLKNSALEVVGSIEVDADRTVVVTNFSGGVALASVTLEPDGDISLAPATGKRVIIAGDLDVGRVTYTGSGGIKKNLT